MLPGLIDAHGHVMGLGFAIIQLDLTGTTSVEEMKQRLKAYAEANPGDGWIIGRGWNQELWSEKRFPTSADLDAVVPDRPVWLSRVDGHAAVGNSAALRAAGVTSQTKAPDGGEISDGLFVDNATALVEAKIQGHEIAPAPEEPDCQVVNLMEALRRSVAELRAAAPEKRKRSLAVGRTRRSAARQKKRA